ncbi:MAG: hypothetical protein EXR72_15705 [Myxococcales bacterium]|nr:hypothetical protein [Myxococcales bacterium]
MGRREITLRTAIEDVFNQVSYVASALTLAGQDGDTDAAALASGVETILQRGELLHVEKRLRHREILHANALVRRRALQADERITAIRNGALAEVNFDRGHPVFVRLFPEALTPFLRVGLASKLPELRRLDGTLSEPETPETLREAHRPPLAETIERGDGALKAREEAQLAAGRTGARIGAWRDDANAVLLGIEGALKTLAAARRSGRDWVDSFFPAGEPPRKARPKVAWAPPGP